MRGKQFLGLVLTTVFTFLLFFGTVCIAGETTKTEWMAVFLQGKKMGCMKAVRISGDSKTITHQELTLQIKRGGALPVEIRNMTELEETKDGHPLAFKFEQSSFGSSMKSQGMISQDGRLHVKVGTAGQQMKESTIDWPQGAVMEEGSRLVARKMGLKAGTSYEYRQFLPDSLQVMDVLVKVGNKEDVDLLGRVMPLTKVEQHLKSRGETLSVVSYVDEQSDSYKVIMPMMGMTMEMIACTEQYALSRNDPADFFNVGLIPSPKPLSQTDLKRTVSYELIPKDGASHVSVPSSEEQKVSKREGKVGSIMVTVANIVMPAGDKLPYQGSDEAAIAALKPTSFVQSDAKEIIDLAKKATGDSRSTAEAVKRIQNFVFNYITKKDLSVGYASALEVAKGREGDCTEHAILAAALCKAAGIPARIVTGLVYAAQFSGRRSIFVPHAWTQAYVGGKWISFDAALKGFDASHIALSFGDGDPSYFFNLINSLGSFAITDINVRE